jgi:hypothetical protein
MDSVVPAGRDLSVTVWIVVGVGVGIAVALFVLTWERGTKERDLGQVSNTWIAEHRFGQSRDTHR